MRQLVVLFTFFIAAISVINGQEKKDTLHYGGKIYLSIKNINFIRNDEYFHPIIEGYTLIGSLIQPALVYAPTDKLKLKLGTHLLSYAGANGISQAKLILSTTYNIFESTSITVGNLNGSDKHRLFDPHYDFERLYTSFSEDGFQVLTETDHIFSDNWLSWEKFIFPGDTIREVFTTGESFRYTSGKTGDAFSLEIPVQVQFKHFGGQISNYSQHLQTFFNVALGLRINYNISGGDLGTAGFEYLQFINKELVKGGENGVRSGSANWFRFHYNYKALYFGSYYWKSHDFFAPNGNQVYSSVSTRNGSVIHDRRIWTNSIYFKTHPVGGLEIFLGLDAFYDLNLNRVETAFGLHLRFEKLIGLNSK
jgi:hypothetical protein